jgi:hypothetical protein
MIRYILTLLAGASLVLVGAAAAASDDPAIIATVAATAGDPAAVAAAAGSATAAAVEPAAPIPAPATPSASPELPAPAVTPAAPALPPAQASPAPVAEAVETATGTVQAAAQATPSPAASVPSATQTEPAAAAATSPSASAQTLRKSVSNVTGSVASRATGTLKLAVDETTRGAGHVVRETVATATSTPARAAAAVTGTANHVVSRATRTVGQATQSVGMTAQQSSALASAVPVAAPAAVREPGVLQALGLGAGPAGTALSGASGVEDPGGPAGLSTHVFEASAPLTDTGSPAAVARTASREAAEPHTVGGIDSSVRAASVDGQGVVGARGRQPTESAVSPELAYVVSTIQSPAFIGALASMLALAGGGILLALREGCLVEGLSAGGLHFQSVRILPCRVAATVERGVHVAQSLSAHVGQVTGQVTDGRGTSAEARAFTKLRPSVAGAFAVRPGAGASAGGSDTIRTLIALVLAVLSVLSALVAWSRRELSDWRNGRQGELP